MWAGNHRLAIYLPLRPAQPAKRTRRCTGKPSSSWLPLPGDGTPDRARAYTRWAHYWLISQAHRGGGARVSWRSSSPHTGLDLQGQREPNPGACPPRRPAGPHVFGHRHHSQQKHSCCALSRGAGPQAARVSGATVTPGYRIDAERDCHVLGAGNCPTTANRTHACPRRWLRGRGDPPRTGRLGHDHHELRQHNRHPYA